MPLFKEELLDVEPPSAVADEGWMDVELACERHR
jgi:hypothetical protein